MKKFNLNQFTRGWIVGDFEPSIIKSKDFEFMVGYYKKGDTSSRHVHKIANEITVIIHGEFRMNSEILKSGDIVHLSPGDETDFECILDGAIAVVKTPSVMGDKYLIN